MDFKKLVEAYREAMIQDLTEICSIPSLSDPATASADKPFGQACDDALQWMLNKGKQDGFEVKNVDGYAGVIAYGNQSETIGMLGHLDVVPVGLGWSSDPFKPVIKDGYFIARGSGDDKGPTIASYYAMKMLRDLNVPLHKAIWLIVGVDEETGMRCMDYFAQHHPLPDQGFVPDAYFPVIYGEKGILNIALKSSQSTIIHSLQAGERPNIVIGKATVVVAAQAKPKTFEFACNLMGVKGSYVIQGDLVSYTFEGEYSHASTPHKGKNAAVAALNFVAHAYQDKLASELVQLLTGYMGEGLNIAFDGVHMQWLSSNVGIVHIADNQSNVVVDIRYPNDIDEAWILQRINQRVLEVSDQISVEVIASKVPHFVDPTSPLVTTLQKVYQDLTQDTFTPPLTMGGGTYARTLPNFVAYGMKFVDHPTPSWVGDAHQKDEGILIDDLLMATAIYAAALYKLAHENA